jgi:hypothetical protein
MGIGSIILRTLVREGIKEVQAAYSESERLERRKERLQNLGRAHVLIIQDFIKPLCADLQKISQRDAERINRYLVAMTERGDEILNNPNDTTDSDVSRYAKSIKMAALVAISLCKKYEIYSNIQSVRYDPSSKMIVLNNQDHYALG